MLGDDLACGVTLVTGMQAREGEFHGLKFGCCLPSRSRRGVRWRTEVLPRARRYHSRFSNSQHFL